jgi:hypothetical protein
MEEQGVRKAEAQPPRSGGLQGFARSISARADVDLAHHWNE